METASSLVFTTLHNSLQRWIQIDKLNSTLFDFLDVISDNPIVGFSRNSAPQPSGPGCMICIRELAPADVLGYYKGQLRAKALQVVICSCLAVLHLWAKCIAV